MADYPVCRFCGIKKTYHGPECMQEWIAWAQGQVLPGTNQHTATALTGEPGSGKSGGGICIFKAVQQVKPFSVKDQVYFRPADRIHVARRLGKGMVVYGDESSGEGGNKRRAMSQANVDNIMDLDTMRQRNQHSVFTAPNLDSLDSAIKEACQWVHSFNHAHEVISYEVVHYGKPDDRQHFLKERFRSPDFPHAQNVYPDLWSELLSLKDDFLAGRDNKHQEAMRAREDKMTNIMIGVLQPKPKGEQP